MKIFFRTVIPIITILLVCFGVGYLLGRVIGHFIYKERSVVILSTNDMHAKIDNFPQLATAVAECRDTVATILVDAGDRWTGNAFVDLAAEPRRPIIDLMNMLEYDVVTLGNHEFDSGAPYLDKMMRLLKSKVVCANLISNDTLQFRQTEPYTIVEPEFKGKSLGMKLGFLGVVTNYGNNNHPDGNDASFVGLTFEDPQHSAARYVGQIGDESSLAIILSHMGDDRDMEFASKCASYPLIIGGHTHRELDTMVNGVRIVQSGKNLKNIGITVLNFKGKRLRSIDYRNLSLKDYAADSLYLDMVNRIKSAPELLTPVGRIATAIDKRGLAAMINAAMLRSTEVDIALYHNGGIRLDNIPAGGVSKADIYTMEPFSAQVYTMKMRPEDLKAMIIAKYNDTRNPKEAHCIDLYASVPYTILTDGEDMAYDVIFPTLKPDRLYSVAMGDYIFNNYSDVNAESLTRDVVPLTDALIDLLSSKHEITLSNTPLQSVVAKM